MGLETKLVQKMSQSLLMTPQLQQAIKLLQLGRLEYKEAIEKELLDNPVLEEQRESEDDSNRNLDLSKEPDAQAQFDNSSDNSSDDSSSAQTQNSEMNSSADSPPEGEPQSKVDWEDYLESYSDYRGAASPRGTTDFTERPAWEGALSHTESLCEHLLAQIRFSDISQQDGTIILNLVGNIDKNGYLCTSYEEVSEACKCELKEVERVAEILKSLDPPGVGARNLGECLLVQLQHLGLGEGLEAQIVRSHLDKLERRKYEEIAKVEQVSVDQVYKAVTSIQQLEPRPGRAFSDETTGYITPDIYVYKVGSEYVISLNEDGLPKLRVSPYYLQLLKSKDAENSPNRTYLTERLKAASWLIKSIHQRQQTIYKVTESIVKFQKEFLDHGISRLKPLVLKDVAQDIGMHESTVSRVTANKYMHTPQGVFELRFFFTTGIKSGSGEVSSSSIKEKIKNLIASESAEDPISDQMIVEILQKENVDIARRTVAKYREGLGIQSSSKRKKLF